MAPKLAPAPQPFDLPAPFVPLPWTAALSRARTLQQELANAADSLNASLRQAEQALTELNLGVTASVPLFPDEEESDWGSCLRFGKESSAWRLSLESGRLGFDDEWTVSSLFSASKEVRIEAVRQLPALLRKLIETAEMQLEELTARTAEADAFAGTIRGQAK